jgi:CHAT domain-containing protein
MIRRVRHVLALLFITIAARAAVPAPGVVSALVSDFRARLETPGARTVAENAAQVAAETNWELTRQVWAVYDSISVDRINVLSADGTPDAVTLKLRVDAHGWTFARVSYALPPMWTVTWRKQGGVWRFKDADFEARPILDALQWGDLRADAIDATPLSAAIITRYARQTPPPANTGKAATVIDAIAAKTGDDVVSLLALHVRMLEARATGNLSAGSEWACLALAAADRTHDPDLIASTLVLAGHIDRLRGLHVDALARFRSAAAMANAVRDKTIIANARLAAGTLLRIAARYADAFAEAQEALAISEEVGFREGSDLARFNIGMIHADLRQHALALSYLEKAAAGLRRDHRWYNFGVVAGFITIEREAMGNREGAIAIAEEALAIPGTPQSLRRELTLAEIERMRGRVLPMSKLEEGIQRSAVVMNEGAYMQTAQLHWLVDAAMQNGDGEKAMEYALRQLPLLHDPLDAWTELDLGRAYACANQFDKAESHLNSAIRAIEADRRNFPGDDTTRTTFFENVSTPYRALIRLLVDTGRVAEAWEWVTRIKGRVLQDAAARGGARLAPFTAEDEVQRRALLDALAAANRGLLASSSPATAERAQARVATAQANLDRFRIEYLLRHRDQSGDASPIALGASDRVTPPAGAVVFDYLALPDETLLFRVTSEAGRPLVRVTRIALPSETLRASTQEVVHAIGNRDLAYESRLHELDVLIDAPELREARRLYIVPDGPLWSVPFALLRDPRGNDLISKVPFSLLPSAAMLGRRPRAEADAGPILAVGNPTVASTTVSTVRSFSPAASLGALPDSETEVRAVARLYGAKNTLLLVGDEATEANIKKSCPNARILHFATHGFFDEENSLYSGLVLARDRDAADDGILDARELTQLTLHANLAVLSACDTARGSTETGEGLIGLSWAFALAGCPTTVVSQWQAQSKAASELMIEFHRRLIGGDDPAAALRHAELSLRRKQQYRHPFYWAPFVVIGK